MTPTLKKFLAEQGQDMLEATTFAVVAKTPHGPRFGLSGEDAELARLLTAVMQEMYDAKCVYVVVASSSPIPDIPVPIQ